METIDCAIAGCGPAGAMLGLLLARAGLRVCVFEKHADFLRDFRGDTVHPSTLQLLDELGLADAFAKLPARRVDRVAIESELGSWPLANFTRLPGRYNYVALVPQWDLLKLLTEHAQQFSGFELRMQSEVIGVVKENDSVVGLRYRSGSAEQMVRARLCIAADGRGSMLRTQAGLQPVDLGAPIDVLWFRLPRIAGDPSNVAARLGSCAMLVLIDRGEYWQIARLSPKVASNRCVRAISMDCDNKCYGSHRSSPAASTSCAVGTTCICCACSWIACRAGIVPACCASATPRTPCRQSAASVSIWPCRMPSPPPTC